MLISIYSRLEHEHNSEMEDTTCQVSRATKMKHQIDDEQRRISSSPPIGTNQAASAAKVNNKNVDYFECNYNNNDKTNKEKKVHRPGSALDSSGGNLSDGEGSSSRSSSSGHGGSGSGPESAFSSTSDEDNALDETISEPISTADSLSPSSGRSSANPTGDDDDTVSASNDATKLGEQLKTSWNLVPQRHEAIELIDQVRVRFLDNLREHDAQSEYDALDLDELRRDLPSHTDDQLYQSLSIRLISRFLNFDQLLSQQQQHTTKREASKKLQQKQANSAATTTAPTNCPLVEKALVEATEKLDELLQFRHHYQLAHVLTDQFSKEIYQLHGIFPFGYDKNQLPVLYLRARVHRRWSQSLDETFKRYVAWQVDVMTKSNHGANVVKTIGTGRSFKDGSFGICFDCLNVSYACVDMDFLRYLVKILVNYYPTYCRYALCVDLPWLFRSVWKLVRSWLPEEAQSTVHLIMSKQLVEFIDEDQIPNSMKINDLPASKKSPRGKHKLPAEFNSLNSFDELARDLNLTTSEIKQFKAHIDKVLKEYEQLGAI